MMSEVEYLGYRITKDGLQPSESKIKAIMQAPIPHNVTELKAFLGLINYYGKFCWIYLQLKFPYRIYWEISEVNNFIVFLDFLVTSKL